MIAQALPFILLQGFLFGSTLVISRFSVGQFNPTTYIGLRMTLAALGHVAFYVLDRQRAWPKDVRLWRRAALLGVLGTAIPMTAIVNSLQYQSAGLTSVLVTANPALTVLLAHFFLADESLTTRKGAGVALALGGALLLTLRGESGLPDMRQANPLGYGLVFLGMSFASGMTIYARRFMQDLDHFDVASVRMLVAALAVMPLSVLFLGLDLHKVNTQGYLALGYAALLGTFMGMLIAFYNVKRFGATVAAMPAYIIPVVSGLGGALFLDERITASMLVGLVLIGGGLVLINRSGNDVPQQNES